MLTHTRIWEAIDRLAQANGLSPSGLARRAGLDATSFNPSKRIGRDGRPRWPSTESIAKILAATETDAVTFLGGASDGERTLPAISLEAAGRGGRFDPAGRPAGDEWQREPFGDVDDPGAFIIVVAGEVLRPFYRDGDRLVVSPGRAPQVGHRVALATRTGQVLVGDLLKRTQRRIEIAPPCHREPTVLQPAEVAWLSRIVWATR